MTEIDSTCSLRNGEFFWVDIRDEFIKYFIVERDRSSI